MSGGRPFAIDGILNLDNGGIMLYLERGYLLDLALFQYDAAIKALMEDAWDMPLDAAVVLVGMQCGLLCLGGDFTLNPSPLHPTRHLVMERGRSQGWSAVVRCRNKLAQLIVGNDGSVNRTACVSARRRRQRGRPR